MKAQKMTLLRFLFWSITLWLMYISGLAQQQHPIKWYFNASSIDQELAEVTFTAVIASDWYLYGHELVPGGPMPTHIEFKPASDFELIGDLVQETKSVHVFDDQFLVDVPILEKTAVFTQRLRLLSGAATVIGSVFFMASTGEEALPVQEQKFALEIKVKQKVAPQQRRTPARQTKSIRSSMANNSSERLLL